MKLAEVDDAHEDCVFVSWLMFVILALNTARIATIATSYYICNYYNFKLIREYKKEPIILIYLFISNLCCYMQHLLDSNFVVFFFCLFYWHNFELIWQLKHSPIVVAKIC